MLLDILMFDYHSGDYMIGMSDTYELIFKEDWHYTVLDGAEIGAANA